MTEARIELDSDENRLRLTGDLSFCSVPALREQALPLLQQAEDTLEIDLSGVGRSDSAGLALLVEWMRTAKRLNKSLRYLNIPMQMLAIARVSSLDQILPLARG